VARKQIRNEATAKKQKKGDTLAAVTPLVSAIFDSMFQGQMDEKAGGSKKRRCGICEVMINCLIELFGLICFCTLLINLFTYEHYMNID